MATLAITPGTCVVATSPRRLLKGLRFGGRFLHSRRLVHWVLSHLEQKKNEGGKRYCYPKKHAALSIRPCALVRPIVRHTARRATVVRMHVCAVSAIVARDADAGRGKVTARFAICLKTVPEDCDARDQQQEDHY